MLMLRGWVQLARFLGFILGQAKPHDDLKTKSRTTYLSSTFPDIRGALPNLDILSVGSDAIELRVDHLREPKWNGRSSSVPSLEFVGEQVMLMRQRTELPIIFTTRCRNENGFFPMDDPMLYYKYLHKAIQWGCDYIDVDLWLPVEIRRSLAAEKGNSKIISALHDMSGEFKWTSSEAHQLFKDGAMHSDVVKMNAMVSSMEDNYQLEHFRSTIQSTPSHPPFSGINMGIAGQLSRTLNKVFTPITHPLLPVMAAPGQLSAAEINSMLHSMGQLPRSDIYAFGNLRANGQAMFFEKCMKEICSPHRLLCVERTSNEFIETIVKRPNFGGALLSPPLPAAATHLLSLTGPASSIGQVDTVVVYSTGSGTNMVGDNINWRSIHATLIREFVPSAYAARSALVLANAESQAAGAIYALKHLGIGTTYTIGFHVKGSGGTNIQQFRGLEDMKKVDDPFVIISALPADKSYAVTPLLKHYSNRSRKPKRSNRVFVDLSNGVRGNGDSVSVASDLGYRSYGVDSINAYAMVESVRTLLGCNVGYNFVAFAGGRSLYA